MSPSYRNMSSVESKKSPYNMEIKSCRCLMEGTNFNEDLGSIDFKTGVMVRLEIMEPFQALYGDGTAAQNCIKRQLKWFPTPTTYVLPFLHSDFECAIVIPGKFCGASTVPLLHVLKIFKTFLLERNSFVQHILQP